MRSTKPLHVGDGTTAVPPDVYELTEWTGAVSGSFATAGNWTNGVPVESGTAIYNQGSVDCDLDLDQSALTVSELLVHDAYTGNIGDGTNSLQINASILKVNKRTGFVHLDGTFTNAHILNTSGDTCAVKLAGAPTTLYVYGSRSDILVDTDSTMDACYVVPRAGATAEMDVSNSSAGAQSILHVDRGGYVTAATDIAAIYCEGGVLTLLGSVDSTTLEIGGGTLINQADGTHTTLELWEGVYSMHQNTDIVALEITNSSMWGGRMVMQTGLGQGVMANPLHYWGGELWADIAGDAGGGCACGELDLYVEPV